MAIRDLTQFLEDDGLEYPLPPSSFEDATAFAEGKTYRVQSPSAKTGLLLTALYEIGAKAAAGGDLSAADVARLKLDDDGEKDLYQRVLGDTYDEMLADGVKWSVLHLIGQDAYLCFVTSTDVANAALAGPGEARARTNRAARRTGKKTAGSKSSRGSTAATGSVKGRKSPTSGSSTSPNGSEVAAMAV